MHKGRTGWERDGEDHWFAVRPPKLSWTPRYCSAHELSRPVYTGIQRKLACTPHS